jgi:PST family polysaccharide transporter
MHYRRTIIENLASLLGVQLTNYVLQLATLPYLIRVLGISGFGLYTFIFNVVQYFVIVTDYGFNLTATRQISINRNDKRKISEIYSTVMAIKLILFICSVFLMMGIVLIIPKFRNDWIAYLISLLGVFGNLIFPIWYYQGIEKTKYIAIFNSIARILVTFGIFIFVKKESDINIAVLIQSSGVVLAGIMALIIMLKLWPVSFVIPSRELIIITWKDGWNVFITLLSSTFIYNTNIFILGLLTNNQTVGYYAIAEKIVRVFHSLVSPVSTAIFPYVSKLFSESKETAIRFLHKIMFLGSLTFAFFSLILIIFSGILVKIFTGYQSSHIQILIIILSPLPLSIFMDNLYGQQILLNIGCSKEFMKSILFPGLLSFIMSFIFVPFYKEYATTIIYLLSEIAILYSMIFYSRKAKIYLVREGIF